MCGAAIENIKLKKKTNKIRFANYVSRARNKKGRGGDTFAKLSSILSDDLKTVYLSMCEMRARIELFYTVDAFSIQRTRALLFSLVSGFCRKLVGKCRLSLTASKDGRSAKCWIFLDLHIFISFIYLLFFYSYTKPPEIFVSSLCGNFVIIV